MWQKGSSNYMSLEKKGNPNCDFDLQLFREAGITASEKRIQEVLPQNIFQKCKNRDEKLTLLRKLTETVVF